MLLGNVAERRQYLYKRKKAVAERDNLQSQALLEKSLKAPFAAVVQFLQYSESVGDRPTTIKIPNSRNVQRSSQPSSSRRMNMALLFATLLLVTQGTNVSEVFLPENANTDEKTETPPNSIFGQQSSNYASYKSNTLFFDHRYEMCDRQAAVDAGTIHASASVTPLLSIEQQFNTFKQRVASGKESGTIIQYCKMFIREALDHFTADETLDNSDLSSDLIKDLNPAEDNYSEKLAVRAKQIYEVGQRAREYEKRVETIFKRTPNKMPAAVQSAIDDTIKSTPNQNTKYLMGDPKTQTEVAFSQAESWINRDDFYSVAVGIRGAGRIEMDDISQAILPTAFTFQWLVKQIDPGLEVVIFEAQHPNSKVTIQSPLVFRKQMMEEVWKKHLGNSKVDIALLADYSAHNPAIARIQGELMGVPEDQIEAFVNWRRGPVIPKKTNIECGSNHMFFQNHSVEVSPKAPTSPHKKTVSRRGKKALDAESAESVEQEPKKLSQESRVLFPITPLCRFVHQIWGRGEKVIKNHLRPR